ncbi:hypothetical protein Dimus_033209 [Dionaea muscipula]
MKLARQRAIQVAHSAAHRSPLRQPARSSKLKPITWSIVQQPQQQIEAQQHYHSAAYYCNSSAYHLPIQHPAAATHEEAQRAAQFTFKCDPSFTMEATARSKQIEAHYSVHRTTTAATKSKLSDIIIQPLYYCNNERLPSSIRASKWQRHEEPDLRPDSPSK